MAERINRARSADRFSVHGKSVRAAGEKRRRLRKQSVADEFVEDFGTKDNPIEIRPVTQAL